MIDVTTAPDQGYPAQPSAKPTSVVEHRPGRAVRVWSMLKNAPLSAWFGMTVMLLYTIAAVFAPLIAPYGEAQVFNVPFAPWSREFLLGTDQIGRDLFTRLVYGARNTIAIAAATTVISFTTGVTLGLIAALAGGWLDQVLSRLVDVLMSIPSLIFSLMLLSIFGPTTLNLIFIIAVLDSTAFFRLSRSLGSGIAVMDYIEVARLRGEPARWIVFREILPNISAALIAEVGLRFCFVFLTIASLSFLGVGIQPPTADWGSMVRENATLITYGDITPLLPAAAIALLTIAVNFVVDWLLQHVSGAKHEH